jgi:hypothetical protein
MSAQSAQCADKCGLKAIQAEDNAMGYIYCAAVYCDKCGEEIKAELDAKGQKPTDPDDQRTYDSGDYPKSVDVASEESDVPEHCDNCRVFLENPLTSHGYSYVKDALNSGSVIEEWASYYGFTKDEETGVWSSDEEF